VTTLRAAYQYQRVFVRVALDGALAVSLGSREIFIVGRDVMKVVVRSS